MIKATYNRKEGHKFRVVEGRHLYLSALARIQNIDTNSSLEAINSDLSDICAELAQILNLRSVEGSVKHARPEKQYSGLTRTQASSQGSNSQGGLHNQDIGVGWIW